MRHRLQQKVFDGEENRSSSPQESRTPSTFTFGKNPHLTKKNKLHSKSTYFYRWGSRLNYVMPSVCGLALLVGGSIAINPVLDDVEKVSAESESVAQADTASTISFKLIDGDANQQTAAEVGKVVYRSNVFQVAGAGISRYIVTLGTASGDTGDLRGRNNPYATIGKVSANTAPTDFHDNTWGYAVSEINQTAVANDSLSYNPVPSGNGSDNSIMLVGRDRIVDISISDSYKLIFAAKLGAALPSDHYEADMYLSVVADTNSVASLGFTGDNQTITKMQQMTSAICNSAADIDVQHRLIDERDNKVYWVAKLKDGNCWMTQNLDYDIQAGSTRISSIANWPGDDNNHNSYYDPGDYYYDGPNGAHSMGGACGTSGHLTTSLSDCRLFSRLNIGYQDMHYHVGNYYSWVAATDGTGSSITSGQAPGSICPIGWKLPTSNNTNKDSFAYLLMQYSWQNTSTQTNSINNNAGIYAKPLYFIFGGNLNGGRLNNAGSSGKYWSATSKPRSGSDVNNGGYHLDFGSNVNPSSSMDRSNGAFVRCIAQ